MVADGTETGQMRWIYENQVQAKDSLTKLAVPLPSVLPRLLGGVATGLMRTRLTFNILDARNPFFYSSGNGGDDQKRTRERDLDPFGEKR
jgi:hypothetical protein